MKTILFYPELPRKVNKVFHLCNDLGVKMINDKSIPHDVAFFWSYDTHYDTPILYNKTLMNVGCIDVSKKRVDRIFNSVFGYSAFIEYPTIFKGVAVEKGDGQSTHDGRIVRFPVDQEEFEKVYMKLIDNRVSLNIVEDIRIFICGGKIVMVIVKEKPAENLFLNSSGGKTKNTMAEIDDIFTNPDQEKIEVFCLLFGLDFGEIDIIMDTEGKPYIIDVNNIAGRGAFINLTDGNTDKAYNIYRDTFVNTYLK